MRKCVVVGLLLLLVSFIGAENYLMENFNDGEFPPTGWTIDSHTANWSLSTSTNAGGNIPEAKFYWKPQFTGTSRFISPAIDLTGLTNLLLEFKYGVDHYDGAYTLGVATRSGNGDWTIIWQINPTDNVAQTVQLPLDNADVNNSDFQFCFFFTGNSYNINAWYIDDIRVFVPYDHDVRVKSIQSGNGHFDPNTTLTPEAIVENVGLNSESPFDVNCKIYRDSLIVYSETTTAPALDIGATGIVTFPQFTIDENEAYYIKFTTLLAGDQDSTNNSLKGIIDSYTGARQKVIIETATGTWCPYCPGSALGIEDLLNNGKQIAAIEYHGGDSFENVDGQARISYYDVSAYPTGIFDGVESYVGGSNSQSVYSHYLPLYEDRIAVPSPLQLAITGTHTGTHYDVSVHLSPTAPILGNNFFLMAAVTESHIQINWQGQTEVNFVERLMVPDANGTSIDFSGLNDFNVNLSFDLNAAFDTTNCELTVFVQNLATKEIIQGMNIPLLDLSTDIDDNNLTLAPYLNQNYPNPFNPNTTISFFIPKKTKVIVQIYDINGRLVNTLINKEYAKGGHYKVQWNGKDNYGNKVSSGVYFYTIKTKNFEKTKKMVLLK